MNRKSALSAEAAGETTRLERFLNVACPYTPILAIFFSIALLFILLSLLTMAALPATSGAYVVSLLTIVLNGFVITVTGPVLYFCRKHHFE